MKKKIIMLSTIPLGNKKANAVEVKIIGIDALNENMKAFHSQGYQYEPVGSGKICHYQIPDKVELSTIYGECKNPENSKLFHRQSRIIKDILTRLEDI